MARKGWIRISAVLFVVVFVLPALTLAQQFPTKPVNVVIGFSVGGVFDVLNRILASKAEKYLGQPMISSNMAGAGSSLALGAHAKQKPDGYNLVSCTTTGLTLNRLYRPVPYKLDDFVPIMQYGSPETGTVVQAGSPYKTMKDLVEYARKNPGKVTYSTSGTGSGLHLCMEFVAKQEGIQWTHVPYSGSSTSIPPLLGGHITAAADGTIWYPYVKEGTLRLLCTHWEARMKALPEVPTLRDLGYDVINDAAFMFAAPKGTPDAVVKTLDEALRKAMDDPEFIQAADKMHFRIKYRGAAELKKWLAENDVYYQKLLHDLKIQKEEGKK